MGKRYTVTLPWPDALLFQNSRGHWRQKADAVRDAKFIAEIATREAIGRDTGHSPHQRLIVEWYPRKGPKRDIQNMPESMKSYIDGIAKALKVDDKHFRPAWPEVYAGQSHLGKVVFHIEEYSPVDVPVSGLVAGDGRVVRYVK